MVPVCRATASSGSGPPRRRGRRGAARRHRTIQAELDVRRFPPEVEAAAAAAARPPRLPELDRTDIALLTIDPPGVDGPRPGAAHRAAPATGTVVRYAIADVAAFVAPGDPVDVEAHRRGETLYGADSKIPLHPQVLSEDAASLLPDQVRPALLWTIDVDAAGERHRRDVERALVRSRAARLRRGRSAHSTTAPPTRRCVLLREVGELRIGLEADRGGVSLPLPEQEVDVEGDGGTSSSARSCRSSAGTRRSRCSPGSRPPR